jgi:hypothetical protein
MERRRDSLPVSSGGSRSAKSGLGKLYDRLTAEERFRLDVEAMARGDEADSRRLVDTCPRREYRMNEVAFTSRWSTARQITLALCLDLSQYLAGLTSIEALLHTTPYLRVPFVNEAERAYLEGHEAGSRYAWQKAGLEGDPPGWKSLASEEHGEEGDGEDDPAIEEDLEVLTARLEEADIAAGLLEWIRRDLAESALPLWRAYEAFCEEELAVEPRSLLTTTFEPILLDIQRLEDIVTELSLKPEEEPYWEYRQTLSELWSQRQREPA